MSVKRYGVGYKDSASGRYAAMLDKSDGGYVSYEDYAALEQKLAESQREFRAADATIENMQMHVEKLAAENAGLKSKAAELVHEASEVYSAYNSTITEPDGDFMDMQTLQEMQCVETPATDAFLAEVRAQGVEMFAAWNDKHIKPGVEHKESLTAVSHAARGFAGLLRKGVQS